MLGATLVLALGATLLAVFRLSGSPIGAGVLVFVGAWFVAIGCAMQLGAVVDTAVAGRWRIAMKGGAWAVTLGATGWAIARAPGPELLTGLLAVPPVIGLAGVVLSREGRWPAVGFAAVSLSLTVLLVPAALERLMMD